MLEVPEGASKAEIDKAYRLLVKVWHPDRFDHDPDLREQANKKLKAINEAYEFLKEHAKDSANSSDGPTVSGPFEDYTDNMCVYLGGDPRMITRGKYTSEEIPAAVCVAENGLTLVTLNNGSPEQTIFYEAKSIRLLENSDGWWMADGVKPNPEPKWPPGVREDTLFFRASDPEGVVKNFGISLRFRNNYYSKLFSKKLIERAGLEKWKSVKQFDPVGGGCALALTMFALLGSMMILLVVLID